MAYVRNYEMAADSSIIECMPRKCCGNISEKCLSSLEATFIVGCKMKIRFLHISKVGKYIKLSLWLPN
jgi:hypothetical protein